jgi:hypothetical protein
MSRKHVSVVAAVVALSLMVAGASGRGSAANEACNPNGKLVGNAVVFCGSARASLSVFAGAVFKNGSCRNTTVGGSQFTVKLGARTQNAQTNDGRPYFGLIVTGSLSNPTGGGVIAYWKGKRWGGAGVSFKGNVRAGSFVASGINGSHGHATGSYRC